MLKSKPKDREAIEIPARIAERLKLKNGTLIAGRVERGKLRILRKEDRIAKIMRYAGIWKEEKVDEVFRDIRRNWNRWKETLSA